MRVLFPDNWKVVQIKELILSLESGGRPKGGVKGILEGIPSIGGEHLSDNGGFKFKNIRYIPEKYYLNLKKGHIENNNILIVKDGATTGKTSFANTQFPFKKAVVNEHVFVLKISKKIISKFIFYYLWSEEGNRKILKNFQGSAQGGINRQFISNTLVPLTPLNEQKRIVAKLDKIIPRIDAVKERLENVPTIIKRFRQSVLTAAVTGKLTEKWRKEQINLPEWKKKELATLVNEGPQNGLYKNQSFYGKGVLILRIGNFYDGQIHPWNSLKRLRLTKEELATWKLNNSDIIINRVNSMDFLGKSGLVRNLEEPCVFESNMMRLSVVIDLISPEYLIRFLNCQHGLQELRKNAKHAVNQSSINQQDVKTINIPLPPLTEQIEIVRQVDKLFALADKLENHYQIAKAKVDKLSQSVLAKAFRGELVPQDPDDEPAEKLLARIQEEKAKMEAELKKIKRKISGRKKAK